MLTLLIITPLGCSSSGTTAEEKPNIIPGGKGNLSGGGALGGPRNAAARTVNDIQLSQLHKYISIAMTADADQRVPNAEQIMQEIRQDGKLVGLIKDEVIILTNNTSPQGIWAYTKWPQRGGNHYIITSAGRADMSPAQLQQALQAQGTTAKLEN
jgi:hypothetical protein